MADLSEGMHNSEYDLYVNKIYIDSVYEVYKFNSNKYSKVIHRLDAIFQIKKKSTEDSLQMIQRFDNYCRNLTKEDGENDARCDYQTGKIKVVFNDYSYVIFLNEKRKWYILSSQSIVKHPNLIPDEVKNKMN